MRFRVFNTKTKKTLDAPLIDGEGNVWVEGLCGYENVGKKDLRIDLLVGFDENKNPIYERDQLILKYPSGQEATSEAYVFFDGNKVWLSVKGSLIPFKEAGMKIYLKD